MDLEKAYQKVEVLHKGLENERQKAEEKIKQIYADVKQIAEELNVEVKKPRTYGKQMKRENHNVNNCENYIMLPENMRLKKSNEITDLNHSLSTY